MKLRPLARLRRALAWMRSLHAKLFLVTALLTSFLTVMVALTIVRNNRREFMTVGKNLAIQTAQAVSTEILQRDPRLEDPRTIETILASLASRNGSIFQIDVFERVGKDELLLKCTSLEDPQDVMAGDGLASYLKAPGPQAELVELTTGTEAWKVYLPIQRNGRPPIGLIRVYCDLERWETVWRKNMERTYRLLPPVLLGEFILLWLILGSLVDDPMRAITRAMGRLESGDASARAAVSRRDELGQIATRFNLMADQLQRAATEREALIEEIQGFNATLQTRIEAALQELQDKNQELEQLMERNALLREELGQQERLAVAGQLTAAFAHEVGTPLNLVNGHLQLLRAQTDLGERTRERLDTIQAQIERVGDIVRRLLGHTRRPQIHQEPVPLHALAADLQRLWAPNLATHRVSFALDVPEDCTLYVDRKQMEQIFINLVNNAVDAMPEGGAIRLEARPDAEAPSGTLRWRLSLSDTGTGIPAELLPKVFKPMFTTKPEGKGTGLGLAIVREIVRNHGGEPQIESVLGQGTTVRFSLPGMPRLEGLG